MQQVALFFGRGASPNRLVHRQEIYTIAPGISQSRNEQSSLDTRIKPGFITNTNSRGTRRIQHHNDPAITFRTIGTNNQAVRPSRSPPIYGAYVVTTHVLTQRIKL